MHLFKISQNVHIRLPSIPSRIGRWVDEWAVPHQLTNPELGKYKGCVGSFPWILHVSAVPPEFPFTLDLSGKPGAWEGRLRVLVKNLRTVIVGRCFWEFWCQLTQVVPPNGCCSCTIPSSLPTTPSPSLYNTPVNYIRPTTTSLLAE